MAYVISHNTPSVGFVSWQDLHMQYNGSAYAIANGNTDKVYIWWEIADPYVLKSSNTYPTLGAADALVLLNKNGTAFLVPGSTVLDGSLIVPGTILADALSANSVTGEKILAGAIDTGHLAAGAITADKIDADAVIAGKVAANAIGAAAIAAGAILSDHLYAGAVTAGKIAAGAVTADKILANNVTAGKIAAGAVGATEIAAFAVSTTKLAVIPNSINPDRYCQDDAFWNKTYDAAHSFERLDNNGSNVPFLMGVPSCFYFNSSAGTSFAGRQCKDIPLAAIGKQIRFRYKVYNNSNQSSWLGIAFADTARTWPLLYNSQPAGSGLTEVNLIGTVPATTKAISIWMRNNGGAMTGEMAFSDIRVDLPFEADLIVDGAITTNKIYAGAVTATKISVSNLSSLSANIGTVTAGIITGTTFRTTSDGSGNYMELSGTTFKGKDSGGNTIWEMFPALGPLALTDFSDAAFETAMTTAYFDVNTSYATWNDPTVRGGTIEDREAARAAAMAWYATKGVHSTAVGRWNVTSILPSKPRYVLVAITATVTSNYKAEPLIGPISTSAGTYNPTPGIWSFVFLQGLGVVRTGIPGANTDTRLVIVPIQKIGSDLFIQRSYYGSLTGVSSAKIRIVGIFP